MGCVCSLEADQFSNGSQVEGESEFIDVSSIQTPAMQANKTGQMLQRQHARAGSVDISDGGVMFKPDVQEKGIPRGSVPPVAPKPPLTLSRLFIMSTFATYDVKYSSDLDDLKADADKSLYMHPSPPTPHSLSTLSHIPPQARKGGPSQYVTQLPADKTSKAAVKQAEQQLKQQQRLQQQQQKKQQLQQKEQQQLRQKQQQKQNQRGPKTPVSVRDVNGDGEWQPDVQHCKRVMWPLQCLAGLGQRVQPRNASCLLANHPLSSAVW